MGSKAVELNKTILPTYCIFVPLTVACFPPAKWEMKERERQSTAKNYPRCGAVILNAPLNFFFAFTVLRT